MTQTAKTGRNDPCPCGSGKKYKHCCVGKEVERTTFLTKWMAVLLGVLGLALAAGAVASLFEADSGAGPPDRVWSDEHGHWH